MEKLKKSIVNFVLIFMLLFLVGCGEKIDLSYLSTSRADIDLLALDSEDEMFNEFVKVYNNVKYLYGNSITVRGIYDCTYQGTTRYDIIYLGDLDGTSYYIEIDFDGEVPDRGDTIEVRGLIDYYYEDGICYDQINVLELNVVN